MVGGNLLVKCFIFKLLCVIQTNCRVFSELVYENLTPLHIFKLFFFPLFLLFLLKGNFSALCHLPVLILLSKFSSLSLSHIFQILTSPCSALAIYSLPALSSRLMLACVVSNLYHIVALCAPMQCFPEYSEGSQ